MFYGFEFDDGFRVVSNCSLTALVVDAADSCGLDGDADTASAVLGGCDYICGSVSGWNQTFCKSSLCLH